MYQIFNYYSQVSYNNSSHAHAPYPGGFVVPPQPSSSQEPQLTSLPVEERGRTTEHHKEHDHKHHRSHHSSHRSRSHSRTQNIVVHAYGQTYQIPAVAGTGQYHGISIPQATVPVVRQQGPVSQPVYNAVRPTTHANSIPITIKPTVKMPIPHSPPREAQYYGPEISKSKKMFYQYSQCTGRKKALCIGINYIGESNELNGCIADARRMRRFLIKYYGFHSGDIVLLTDEGKTQRERPTRRNIIDAMQWLVRDAHPHDSLVFHYSGHGGQTKDLDGDEEDGFDEVIYPLDYKKQGHIVDDDMHTIMVKPLPAGCRLTAIFDCCHSGSALDLPYTYGTRGQLKREPDLDSIDTTEVVQGTRSRRTSIDDLTRGIGGMMNRRTSKEREKWRRRVLKMKYSPADVISWSGCKDSQTSADTYEGNEPTGAMSYAFMSSLKANPNQSYQELLVNIRKILKKQFSQKPQLSSSHPIDVTVRFVM
ncbi:peptidase C14 [Pyrrhoderma noxium]|uniref:Peptidase C14 n=1 Tax=Pyrrhoderma noxium TaxID=2282107 RepID=A0A286UDV7_9AGAM|nr:peptidase C14 [Pyrrhoderma noxium]